MTKTEAEKNSDKYHGLADRAYLKHQESGDARYYREQQRYEDIAEAFGLAAEAVEDVQKYRELKAELLYLAGRADRAIETPDITRMGGILDGVIAVAKVYAGYKPIERMDNNDG